MNKTQEKADAGCVRVIFSLPKPLAGELGKYARLRHGGNKSGFTADALRFYIDHLHKTRYTQKLRESYAAAARRGLAIAQEWEPLDDEAWAKLDERQ
jgi:hypothetical protein